MNLNSIREGELTDAFHALGDAFIETKTTSETWRYIQVNKN